MFVKFCCSQSIRSLYHPSAIPEDLRGMIAQYIKTYASDTRGSRLSDVFSDEERFGMLDGEVAWQAKDFKPLEVEDHQLLREWMDIHCPLEIAPRVVVFRKEIFRFGQRYTSNRLHNSDSHIVYHTGGGDWDAGSVAGGHWGAGAIVDIFSQATIGGPSVRTWVIVLPYKALRSRHESLDPYRRYPVAGGRLFRHEWESNAIVIEAKAIISHCASASLNIEFEGSLRLCRLCLPLNKI